MQERSFTREDLKSGKPTGILDASVRRTLRGTSEKWRRLVRAGAEFVLSVNDGVRLTLAHIHCAPAGVNGPVVVFLAGLISQGLDVDGRWIGNATFTDANIINTSCGSTLAEIAQSMRDGNMYANVHSVANPGGEVRGQLRLK